MLDRRNDLAHRHDEVSFLQATMAIRADFAALLTALANTLAAGRDA